MLALNITKKIKLFIITTCLLIASLALGGFVGWSEFSLAPSVSAQPAGCTGGPAGPKAPGTNCSGGNNIPAGCTGGPAGPKAPGTICPGSYTCGKDDPATVGKIESVQTKFNFGCEGKGSPIQDLFLAIIDFLALGVGLAVIIAIIVAGIKYASAEGNPETTAQAKNNIQMALIGLIIYIFIYALAQFLVPGGAFA